MKALVTATVLLMMMLTPVSTLADDGTDLYVELLRADLRAEKRDLVEDALDLKSDAEWQKFWPIYDAYEAESIALGDRTIDLINRYPDAVNLTGPETLRPLGKEWFKLREDRLELMQKYYKKVDKAVSLRAATRWMQIEHRLQLLIDLQIAAEVPMVSKPR